MLICDWSSDVCSSDLGPPSAGTRDRRGADIIVGGIGQDQRAPTGLGQASVIGTCHQSRKFERSGTIDLYGGGVGTGVDQGESAIRSGVGAADVGEGPILQNKVGGVRSEEHTSELQSLMRNSYAVFRLKKIQKKNN